MIWHFVDEAGEPTGQTFSGPERLLAANSPVGCKAVPGDAPQVRKDHAEGRRLRALLRIQALEAKQHRRIRELLKQSDPQLQALDEQIDLLRRRLTAETDTSAP